LLIPLVRFLPPADERVRTTVLAIADELQEDGPELLVIVGLPVLDDVNRAIFVCDRLIASGEVDDCQRRAAMPTHPSTNAPPLSGPRWKSV
jgi:hypothetical protein